MNRKIQQTTIHVKVLQKPSLFQRSGEYEEGRIYSITPSDGPQPLLQQNNHPRSKGGTSPMQVNRRKGSCISTTLNATNHSIYSQHLSDPHEDSLREQEIARSNIGNLKNCNPNDLELSTLPTRWREEAMLAKRIDKISRGLFPIMFALFNIIYWVYYKVLEWKLCTLNIYMSLKTEH